MEKLLDAVATLVTLVSPEKVEAIASRIRGADASKAASALQGVVATPFASSVVTQLIETWQAVTIGSDELAAMLRAACHTFTKTTSAQSTELVWTGPSTGQVPVRHTEQVLRQVIDAAKHRLFIVSFVAYEVDSIIGALDAAVSRDVRVDILLESSTRHGGHTTTDSLRTMREAVPKANFYVWSSESSHPGARPQNASVHAKCAVSDGKVAFITSANLSAAAMERNMELGVLVNGGTLPDILERHLDTLIITKTICRA